MRFLSVAGREMRAAARRNSTYYVRWLTGVVSFIIFVWLLWSFGGFQNTRVSGRVFEVFAVLIFFYCLFVGAAGTADSLSAERREGTLGLLYLTNLNSAEIVTGKLCSHALALVYGLLAIFPILALPLLLGGITFDQFGRTVLALGNTILFSVAAGFAASVVCVRQFPAVALATGLALGGGAGLLAGAGIVDAYRGAKWLVDLLAVGCPFYPLLIADGSKMFGRNYFWIALAVNSAGAGALLAGVTWQLSRSWRDRPAAVRPARRWKFWQRPVQREPKPADAAFRRRLLAVNPFYWLAGRKQLSSPVYMGIVILLVLVTAYVIAPTLGRTMRAGSSSMMIGCLLAWLWTIIALHALSLYYAAFVASQRLAEDKQTGSLEMILCTPTTERSIGRGLSLAYARRMTFPAVCGVLLHCFFIWQVMIMAVLEHPGQLPKDTTPGELFWACLFNESVRGFYPEWVFSFLVRMLLLILVLLVVVWMTCGWVGRWLGLRLKHAGFAPVLTLALIVAPPVLLFSFLCYVADELNLHQLGERQVFPLLLWLAFAIGVVHCSVLTVWAARRLRQDFRATVTSRFQPPARRRWWRPTLRGMLRFAGRTALAIGILVLIGAGIYGWLDWRSRNAWRHFQTELRQRGASLDLARLWPPPAPEAQNFFKTPAFQKLLATGNGGLAKTLAERSDLNRAFERYTASRDTLEWTAQQSLPLIAYANWVWPAAGIKPGRTNNAAVAPVLLQELRAHDDLLRELAAAARVSFCQLAPVAKPEAVIFTAAREATLLERLQFLFVLRADARLIAGEPQGAGEDVLTGLQLTRLARQLPDARAPLRVQIALARTVQPIWEGLVRHQWNESQLAAMQRELMGFDLIADYTNAVQRIVVAHLNSWVTVAENRRAPLVVPYATGGVVSNPGWRWQPRAAWYDRCIQLYRGGERVLRQIDAANQRIRLEYDGEFLQGLLLGEEAEQVLSPYPYLQNQANATLPTFATTVLNQTIAACALERYRLAQGSYPPALAALVPGYLDRLPRDTVSGRALIYERLENERFILRGVGPNGTDDRKTKSADDWLWAFPTNALPALPPQ